MFLFFLIVLIVVLSAIEQARLERERLREGFQLHISLFTNVHFISILDGQDQVPPCPLHFLSNSNCFAQR